ncbi:LLM class flavin-dependent oxidoreductase [Nocardia miyunensis]|uniref:LLM class flavin-dependent oxidoreductase n=1 Tax=Nocardia miyunensis TaxID=282684 RepID=UPI00082D4031|nr:LLM class flavin-dependent oxidoreductase [Nocardia miyunensis]
MTDTHNVGVALDAAQVAAIFDRAVTPGGPEDFGAALDASGIDFLLLRPASGDTRFDPSIAATILARHTRSVGLVVGGSVLRDHPYNLARRLGSIDHVSAGRVGWLILTDDDAADGRSVWTAASREDIALDGVLAVRELWESWPPDTVLDDRERGVFTDSARIRYIDHAGAHSISGPLNIPEPPQVKPPIFVESPVPPALAERADVVLGGSHVPGSAPILQWRNVSEAPNAPGVGVAGVVVADEGSPTEIVTAAGRHVTAAAPPPGTTLRTRLGLAAATPVLSGEPRSAFPTA